MGCGPLLGAVGATSSTGAYNAQQELPQGRRSLHVSAHPVRLAHLQSQGGAPSFSFIFFILFYPFPSKHNSVFQKIPNFYIIVNFEKEYTRNHKIIMNSVFQKVPNFYIIIMNSENNIFMILETVREIIKFRHIKICHGFEKYLDVQIMFKIFKNVYILK